MKKKVHFGHLYTSRISLCTLFMNAWPGTDAFLCSGCQTLRTFNIVCHWPTVRSFPSIIKLMLFSLLPYLYCNAENAGKHSVLERQRIQAGNTEDVSNNIRRKREKHSFERAATG